MWLSGGLLLLCRITSLPRHDAVYFCSGAYIHYIPVYHHPYYRDRFRYAGGEFPIAEKAYKELITLPLFHGLSDRDTEDVIAAVAKVVDHNSTGGL